MSARNSLANKQKRREEREAHAARVEKKLAIQRRMEYLAYAPPETYEEIETEVARITEEENAK